MTRLTNTLRQTIVDRAIDKSGLNNKVEQVKQRRFDWADRLRVHLLGGPEKAAYYAKLNDKSLKLHGELPDGLKNSHFSVNRESQMYVNLAGANLVVQLRKYTEAFDQRRSITADNLLVQEFYDIVAELKAAESAAESLRHQVKATVDSFTTIAALVKAWPESAELVAGLVPAPKAQLPAVPVANLNKLIGLPGGAQ